MRCDNRFGMFIHWGFYSLTGLQEQAYARYDLPRDKYEALCASFDPVDYDPAAWVKMAKDAGMSYICFTAKHHDGFCMWNTRYTDYSVMNTPYGKDVLKELADTCHREGMLLSLYYSIPDWHHPLGYNPSSSHQWKAVDKSTVDTEGYRTYVKNQITELLTQYGPIYTLFWDIPPKIEDPSLNELARSLQPGLLINDRGYSKGDFSTPEREYNATEGTRFERRTEACNSFGVQSWGYREKEDFYTVKHLTGAIDRIMAMGGSYLLNVGPDSKGVITEEYSSRLRRVGGWYNRVSEALTDHEADPFDYGPLKDPAVINRKGNTTYFHFYQGLTRNAVSIRRFPGLPKEVTLLNTGKALPFSVEPLPEYFSGETGRCDGDYLHITSIPADELSNEAIVIKIVW